MHLSINIIGDAFADVYCYLEGNMPEHGGDARLSQPMHTVPGGSGLNTATHLSSLLRNFWASDAADGPRTFDVCLQTTINENDSYGRLIASHSKAPGHGFRLINRRVSNVPSCYFGTDESVLQLQKGDKSTGHCAVIVSEGDRSFMTHLGVMEDFRGSQILTNFLREDAGSAPIHHHVHVAGYYNIAGFWDGALASKLAEMRDLQGEYSQRVTISLVPQHDATNEWKGGLIDVLQYIDFLILSEAEARCVTRHMCCKESADDTEVLFIQHVAEFFRNARACIIMTRGSKGALAFRDGKVIHEQKTSRELEYPLDPTGAGDAFAAGFLHGYLSRHLECEVKGDDCLDIDALRVGMQWACAVGTCNVAIQGASVPSTNASIQTTLDEIVNEGSKIAKCCRLSSDRAQLS
ncbi:hypothetical protein ACHAWF_007154 [Thalassiosira exigua]